MILTKKPMKKMLLRMPETMNAEIDAICEELHCGKSQFVRQSILRNLDICRNVEMPLLRRHYAESGARLMRIFHTLGPNGEE